MTIIAVPITGLGYSSSDGIDALLRRNPWLKSDIVSEALVGVVNGVNIRFRLQSYPALDGTVSVLNMAGAPVATSSVDEDSGLIVVSSAPTDTLFANFTHCAYTSSQLENFFIEGFNLMESIWQRDYVLVQSGGVYYVSSDSSSVTDPVISDSAFSERPAQYSLLVECIVLVWAQNVWNEAAANAMRVHDSLSSGLHIDRTRQPEALRNLVNDAQRRVDAALVNAQVDAGEAWYDDTGVIAVEGREDPYPNVWTTLKQTASS